MELTIVSREMNFPWFIYTLFFFLHGVCSFTRETFEISKLYKSLKIYKIVKIIVILKKNDENKNECSPEIKFRSCLLWMLCWFGCFFFFGFVVALVLFAKPAPEQQTLDDAIGYLRDHAEVRMADFFFFFFFFFF